jgi:hypothetical protein
MIATAIAMLLSMQASDTTRASREAFTRCLGRFVDSSMEAGKTAAQFNAEFPQACATEQSAFRNAIIARDTASRSTRASAEESANAEIEDARFNFNDRFQGAQPPQVAAASTAPPAGQPVAQTAAQTTPVPAAQQASQPH